MKLKEAAKKVEDGIEETLTHFDFPSEHWILIRTNNVIERLNREIHHCTRVVVVSWTATLPSCWSMPNCGSSKRGADKFGSL